MKLSNGECLRLMLFGTFNENRYFLGDFRDAFDIIGLNANIIAFARDGMAAFIAHLKNKSYYIDPQVYAFQQPPKTIMRKVKEVDDSGKTNTVLVLKKSVQNLAIEYGPVIEQIVGKEELQPGTITDDDLQDLCKRVLDFQLTAIPNACRNLDEWEFLDKDNVDLKPAFLIAPYFYLEPDKLGEELSDNLRFIAATDSYLESSGGSRKPIYAEIVMHKHVLLDSKQCQRISDEYATTKADGYLLWIDDFSEVVTSEADLGKYVTLLQQLSSHERPILIIHGGYFSVILAGTAYQLAAGVGHGIEYGESRSVVPVGGGVPLAKFYFPKFHKRINYDPDAEDVLLEKNWHLGVDTYLQNVCDCSLCKDVILRDVPSDFHRFGETKISPKDGKAYPTSAALDLSRRHYLHTKAKEYGIGRTQSKSVILSELDSSIAAAKGCKSHSFDHLAIWGRVLKAI